MSVITIVVAVIVLVGGFFLYRGLTQDSPPSVTTTQNTNQPSLTDVATAPAIAKTDDLTVAETVLDQTDVNPNPEDTSQLDTDFYGVLGVQP